MSNVMRGTGRSVVDIDADGNAYLVVKLVGDAIMAEVMRGTGRVMMDFDPATGLAYPLVKIAGGPGAFADYRSWVYLRDEFFGGAAASGSIGELGWNTNGGSIAQGGGTTNEPGFYTLATGGSSGTTATIYTQGSASVFVPGTFDLVWRVRLNTVDTNTAAHIGMQDSVTTVAPTNGHYFQKLDADTNWFAVSRAAGAQVGTRTDTGIAIDTAFITFRIVRTASTRVDFYINGTLVASHSTNIHAANTNTVVGIVNSAAANKTISIGYFSIAVSVTR